MNALTQGLDHRIASMFILGTSERLTKLLVRQKQPLHEYGNAPSVSECAEGVEDASDPKLDGLAIARLVLLGSKPMSSMWGTVVV